MIAVIYIMTIVLIYMEINRISTEYTFGYDRIKNLLDGYFPVDLSNIITKYLWPDIWLCSNNKDLLSSLKKYIPDCNQLAIFVNIKIYKKPGHIPSVSPCCLCRNIHCVFYHNIYQSRKPKMDNSQVDKLFNMIIKFNKLKMYDT